MPTLTTDQENWIKRRLGSFATSFSDLELQDYADDAYAENPDTWLKGAVAFCFAALATGAVNLVNFKQGETSEDQKVIYDRLNAYAQQWSEQAGYLGGVPVVRVNSLRQMQVLLPVDEDEGLVF